jgi:nucleoside-diphosphate-sugar epimerase
MEQKETVLVTGGSGFVGLHAISQLLSKNYKVKATIRNAARKDEITKTLTATGTASLEDLSFVQADLSTDSNWTEAVEDCRYVLHVASPISTQNPADENEMIRPAVDGALRVLKASSNARVKRVVLLSSYGAVGYTNKGTGIVTESDWTNPEDKHLPAYPKSKTLAERAAWEFTKGAGTDLELSVVNPVAILGPSLGSHVSSSFDLLRMLLDGNLQAVPKIVVNVVDVRDVTDLIIRAMLTPEASGQRFIGSTEGKISLPEIAALLKKERPDVSQKVSSRIAPSLVVRVAGLFNARARVAASMLGMNRNVSIAKATRLLGWTPTVSTEQAILASVQSMVEHGIIQRPDI